MARNDSKFLIFLMLVTTENFRKFLQDSLTHQVDQFNWLFCQKIKPTVTAYSVRGSGDQESQAARRTIISWMGDRLA